MKNTISRRLKTLALAGAGGWLALSNVNADTLTYDSATNLGWFTADAWDGLDTWKANDSAVFDVAADLQFDGSTTINDLTSIGSVNLHSRTFEGDVDGNRVLKLRWSSYFANNEEEN